MATLSSPPARSSGISGRAHALRQFEDRDRAVGAGDPERAVGEFDVAGVGLETVRRAAPALLDGLVAGDRGGAARHHDRARGDARRAGRHLVAVALDQPHALRIDAEPLAPPAARTSTDGPAPSPARRCATPPCRPPRTADRPSRRECRRRPRGSSRCRCRAACRSARDAVRRVGKPFQSASASALSRIGREFAAVVDRPVRRLVGHRRRRDEIAPAQRRAIDVHGARRPSIRRSIR